MVYLSTEIGIRKRETQISGTLLSLPGESGNSSVTFRETCVGILTVGINQQGTH